MYQQRRGGFGRQDRGFRGGGGGYGREGGRIGMGRGGSSFGRSGGGFGRSDDYGKSHVNPWQSGMVPGMDGSSSRGGGLLPTPGGQSSNLLNQLTSPEAQLALAGNLLSTILKPQQQQQQQESQQVQQLLNLSALGQLGNRAAAGLASLAQAQMHVQSHSSRSSWGSMGPAIKRRRIDGVPGRRPDLGKPTLGTHGRDSIGFRDRRLQRGGSDLRPGAKSSRPPARRSVGSRSERRDDKRNEKDDKKRDEKKDSEEDQERDEENEESSEEKEDGTGKDDSSSRYAGVPAPMLYCQVCEKKMWDDSSFDNHIRGRNHQMMLERLEESFTVRAQLMRQQVKLAEQKREILLEKLQRQGKKINMKNREYCTMCDLNFVGNILSHRKTATHQKLKTFLHPKCVLCSKEFTTRLDWEKHKLTAFHLKRVVDADEKPDEKSEQDDLDDFDAMDLVTLDSVGNVDDDETQLEDMEEAEETKDKEKQKGEGEEDEKKTATAGEQKAEGASEPQTIADRWSHLAATKYESGKVFGVRMVRKVSGYFCRLCHKFFVQEIEALQTHCKTRSHFEKYVLYVKAKAKAAEQQKVKEEKEKKLKKTKGSEDEEEDDDDDGNWKRRKVNKGDAEEDEEDKGAEHGEDVKADGQKPAEDAEEKMEVEEGGPEKVEGDEVPQQEVEDHDKTGEEVDQEVAGDEEDEQGLLDTQEDGVVKEDMAGIPEEADSQPVDEINGKEEDAVTDRSIPSDPLEEELPGDDDDGDFETLLEKVSEDIGMGKEAGDTGKSKATAKKATTGRAKGRKRK